jgi:hypothetical protein
MAAQNDIMIYTGTSWAPSNAQSVRRAIGLGHLWIPSDHGFITWSFDPQQCGTTRNLSVGAAAGTLQLVRLKVPAASTITNIYLWLTVTGTTLTAGQNFVALYNSAGTLLRQSVDQASNWGSGAGLITMALSSPIAVAAGDYYVGLWWNGASGPTVISGETNASGLGAFANVNLSAPNFRFATTNDTGLTTTAPGTFGTQTAMQLATYWLALS